MLLIILLGGMNFFSINSYAQKALTYNYDSEKNAIYYEEVYMFENKSKEEIFKAINKVLDIRIFRIPYKDSTEIYSVGDFVTIYKNGNNNTDFKMSCILNFKIKDNKFKFYASNLLLRPKTVLSSNVGTNGGWGTIITTKGPKEKNIETYYPRKIGVKHKLFPDIDRQMQELINDIIKTINSFEEDW